MLPKNRPPTHPGQMLLKTFLVPRSMSQQEFSTFVGWTYARVNEIVNGRRGISAETALVLADTFDMEPEFWLNLQRDWDLWHAMQNHKHLPPIDDAA